MKPLPTLLTLLALFTGALLAQNPATKPDQIKLLKQFAGTWKADVGKDNFMTGVPIADRLHPEKAVWRVDILIKSPTQCVQTIYQNGKVVAGKTMNRQ